MKYRQKLYGFRFLFSALLLFSVPSCKLTSLQAATILIGIAIIKMFFFSNETAAKATNFAACVLVLWVLNPHKMCVKSASTKNLCIVKI